LSKVITTTKNRSIVVIVVAAAAAIAVTAVIVVDMITYNSSLSAKERNLEFLHDTFWSFKMKLHSPIYPCGYPVQ
jgi:tellurite resistance protein TehA-like permease